MGKADHTLHRWTRKEYERMIEAGVLSPQARLELVDGDILEMTPQKSPHATGSELVAEVLRQCFQRGYHVRSQKPLAIDGRSEPEPDVTVVKGDIRDYRDHHPQSAVLLVEVSDSTLPFDRRNKAALYARNHIPEYWILNLRERTLEVHRKPSGGTYGEHIVLAPDQDISPLAAPRTRIQVVDLLP